MNSNAPLIVTAALDEDAFSWFQDLRQTHFPPQRNRVPAHLTLFHTLPGDQGSFVEETLRSACRRYRAFVLEVRGPWFIGQGVAYRLSSPELEQLRREMAEAFSPWLTPQDRSPFRPHITIQNKAEPDKARLLLKRLQMEFETFNVTAEALLVWRYKGGPWEPVGRFPFSAS